jgi:hypothetical protein
MKKLLIGATKNLYLKISAVLPKTRSVDNAFALMLFIKTHHRFPKTSGGGIDDAIYHIKTTDEILDPVRVFVTDKALVKQYVKAKVGDACNVATFAVLDSVDAAIHFDYPSDCVIKPTHLSGEVMFRRNGSAVDFDKVRTWFKTNFYYKNREANHHHLRARIIVEPFIFDQAASAEDYKIFCVHGKPIVIQVDLDRYTCHTQNLYTTDWELLPFAMTCPIGRGSPKPGNLDRLLEIAAKLSEEFNLIRIDLYTNGKDVLVGEITNCHQGGMCRFVPPEGEQIMARLLFGEDGFSSALLKERSKAT